MLRLCNQIIFGGISLTLLSPAGGTFTPIWFQVTELWTILEYAEEFTKRKIGWAVFFSRHGPSSCIASDNSYSLIITIQNGNDFS